VIVGAADKVKGVSVMFVEGVELTVLLKLAIAYLSIDLSVVYKECQLPLLAVDKGQGQEAVHIHWVGTFANFYSISLILSRIYFCCSLHLEMSSDLSQYCSTTLTKPLLTAMKIMPKMKKIIMNMRALMLYYI